MKPRMLASALLLPVTAALHLGCNSEDDRLPGELSRQATQLSAQDKRVEAQALMKMIIARYPGTPAAEQATKDLFFIEAMLQREVNERQQAQKVNLKRTMDALTRYKDKRGEYPDRLEELVPEYLEKVPASPWGHAFLYRAYVKQPIVDFRPTRGPMKQIFNTKRDAYELVSLGSDAAPGGDNLAADILVKGGELIGDKNFDPLPGPQPMR